MFSLFTMLILICHLLFFSLEALQRPLLDIRLPLHHPVPEDVCSMVPISAYILYNIIHSIPQRHWNSCLWSLSSSSVHPGIHNIMRLVHLLLSCLAKCPAHIHLNLAMVDSNILHFCSLLDFFASYAVSQAYSQHKSPDGSLCCSEFIGGHDS